MEDEKIYSPVDSYDGVALNLLSKAFALPGVKVQRNAFLAEVFKSKTSDVLNDIIREGPVKAGCSKAELKKLATSLINKRAIYSTGASFAAGLPGGVVGLGVGLTADTAQFFGFAMRLAQELSYLYGESDIWADGIIDEKELSDQLLVYLGVMFGAGGAAAAVRVVSSAFAKAALKKLPRMALTKTFYYPIAKSVAKMLSARMTKEIFAKGVSKAIPILGGAVSGGITFASMRPMGHRLADAFEKAHFDYSKEEFDKDVAELNAMSQEGGDATPSDNESAQLADELLRFKQLLDEGVIEKEDYERIKNKLIEKA